jgi:hypothetical protein
MSDPKEAELQSLKIPEDLPFNQMICCTTLSQVTEQESAQSIVKQVSRSFSRTSSIESQKSQSIIIDSLDGIPLNKELAQLSVGGISAIKKRLLDLVSPRRMK